MEKNSLELQDANQEKEKEYKSKTLTLSGSGNNSFGRETRIRVYMDGKTLKGVVKTSSDGGHIPKSF